MKYSLSPNYSFCAWEGLPFALMHNRSKETSFFNKEQFELLWDCDSYSEIDVDALSEAQRKFLKGLEDDGVIEPAAEGARLQLHSYRKYPCCYREEVQLSITGKCNYRCLHCFQSAPHGVLGQPSTEEVCAELDQMLECGIYRVSLTGGEPLIHEGFWDIVDHIRDNDMLLTTVYSNGALIDQKLLDGFKQRNLRPGWSVSFDGLGYHDHLRGVEGAEEAAINAIQLLVANGFSVGCGYSLTKGSVKSFRESVNFLAQLGVHSIKSGHTMPQGEWLNRPEEWLSDQDYLDFYCEYIPQYLADGRPLNISFEGLFSAQSDATLKRSAQASGHADAGEAKKAYQFMCKRDISEEHFAKIPSCESVKKNFYIGPTGRVVPCMGIDGTPASERFPSLWETPLREILSKSSYYIRTSNASIKDVLEHNPECKDCEVRNRCASGCRSAALFTSPDDYFACDKRTCLICKEDWSSKVQAAIDAAGLS